ncbi:MAG: hypothetical protein K2Y18_10220 [Alphaproteobacteria bacterium]|jgi:hypothetical protein|nr:hypothetical protein [Alphaproteobacteria bacterium]
MKQKFTFPYMALYDLKKGWVYFNPSCKPNPQNYFIDARLESGLRVLIRADSYYVFDFSNAPVGMSIRGDQLDKEGPITTNARIEVIHAFLACLRTSDNRKKKIVNSFPMDFMDNYIILASDDFSLESQTSLSNAFSTCEYRDLCTLKLNRLHGSLPDQQIDETDIFTDALRMLDLLLKNEDTQVVFILAHLYRAAVYHKLFLEIQSTSTLRSIHYWLAKKNKSISASEMKNEFEQLQTDYNASTKEIESLECLRQYRHSGVKELLFPYYNRLEGISELNNRTTSQIQNSFRFLERVFNKMFGIHINVPISQTGVYSLY